jgi:hypothetical protein
VVMYNPHLWLTNQQYHIGLGFKVNYDLLGVDAW